jgi:NADPH:quinone reductase-like Zn-dependent oxidoreductase
LTDLTLYVQTYTISLACRASEERIDVKAIQYHRYGPPEVLDLVADAPDPVVGEGQVLVRVKASSVNPVDWHTMRGEPKVVRLQGRALRAPKDPFIGADLAGIVEAVGQDVTTVRPGDEVFGMSVHTWADLVAVKAEGLVAKPGHVSWEDAGVIGVAALTALQGLRDKGRVGPGMHVLVSGAAGGVGHFAVQIAKALGARVTATTSAANLEMVRSLGADDVLDYAATDATRGRPGFDVSFDAGGWLSLRQHRRALKPGGIAVLAGAGHAVNLAAIVGRLLAARLWSTLDTRTYTGYLAHRTQDDLQALRRMLEAGQVRPVIDRSYGLGEIRDAVRHQETGHARGKVAVRIGD